MHMTIVKRWLLNCILIISQYVSQYTSYSLIFNPLRMENTMKSIATINPAIMENTEHSIDLKVCVTLDHDVSLHFVSLLAIRTRWATFQAENNIRSAPASSALILVSHQSHNACTANCHLCGSGERNGAQRRTKVSFGKNHESVSQ